jgi:threonine-phosphate decarboxylase
MWPNHGGKSGAIRKLVEKNGRKLEEMLDFSANLNPLGTPVEVIEQMKKAIENESMHYPDPDYEVETEIVAHVEGVNKNNVILTNGGAEAIFLVTKLFQSGKAGILQPSFSEYERACKAHHIEIASIVLSENRTWKDYKSLIKNLHVLIICQPNNPTGTIMDETEILSLLKWTKQNHVMVMMDEAFIHFVDINSHVRLLSEFSNLIVIKSLTKIFAVPGVRAGYIVADKEIIRQLKSFTIPWNVNCAALGLFRALPKTEGHIKKTQLWLKNEWAWLRSELEGLGFILSHTAVNFYLLKDPFLEDHEPLILFLAQKGIVARHTYHFHSLEGRCVRLAVRTRLENECLVQHLKKWRQER